MLNKSEIAILTIAVSIGSQNYFKMKQCRHFMQITYSPNNVLITMSCRLRGGCERLLAVSGSNQLFACDYQDLPGWLGIGLRSNFEVASTDVSAKFNNQACRGADVPDLIFPITAVTYNQFDRQINS